VAVQRNRRGRTSGSAEKTRLVPSWFAWTARGAKPSVHASACRASRVKCAPRLLLHCGLEGSAEAVERRSVSQVRRVNQTRGRRSNFCWNNTGPYYTVSLSAGALLEALAQPTAKLCKIIVDRAPGAATRGCTKWDDKQEEALTLRL